VGEEAHGLLSTGKSSCHFAAEGRKEGKEKKEVKILRTKGNKENTRTIILKKN